MTDDLDLLPVAPEGSLDEAVPIISVSSLRENPASASAAPAVLEMASACRDWGFFQVIDHGIDPTLIDEVWMEARHFFAADSAWKKSLMRTRENPWGYFHNELTKNQRDRKEVFDFTTDGIDPIYGAENQWPHDRSKFQQVLCAYRDAVTSLARHLLQAFCIGLSAPVDEFDRYFAERHTGFVRLNYYPVKDPMAGAKEAHLPIADRGVHHHSDAGALTVLLQDEVGGLQVLKVGLWHNITPVPGAFVINTGDMMQVWSNDRYRAAVHRVQAMERTDRYSIPFFFNPTAETRIAPLGGLEGDLEPPHYTEICWSDFRSQRTDGDYADYGPEVQIEQYRRKGP